MAAVPAARALAAPDSAARARPARRALAREEGQWRRALAHVREEERAGCWDLVRAVVEQAVADIQLAGGRDLESAVAYFAEERGELASWHADVLGLDLAALRQRARALLA